MRKRVFVALSGGVDSSVAAALLKERGFDVAGIHMKMWAPPENHESRSMNHGVDSVCRQQFQDRIDAMRVAAKLDIPLQTWDFGEAYRKAVVDYMIREYAAGRTPNPDVMCNRHIKFGLFLQRAIAAGADYVATGHYVRKREVKSQRLKVKGYVLAQARDLNKDQSYFLWTLTQEQLRHCLFPIGEYKKTEVRERARRYGLPTAEKPDSQGVCFIGEFNMAEFLKGYIPERRGRVLTTSGRAVGEHSGVAFYTIGQRHGLGIGSGPSPRRSGLQPHEGGIPYYVAAKNLTANTITVAEGPYDEALFRRELVATDINWISGREPKLPVRCQARIRYRQPLQRCCIVRIKKQESRSKNTNRMLHASRFMLHITFDEPQRAVTPGQSIVFYQENELLGGGIIASECRA